MRRPSAFATHNCTACQIPLDVSSTDHCKTAPANDLSFAPETTSIGQAGGKTSVDSEHSDDHDGNASDSPNEA